MVLKNDIFNIHYLNYPIYRLNYIDNVYDNDIYENDDFLQGCVEGRQTKQTINGLVLALEWALKHPEYDFQSFPPGYTHLSNQDIYYYLSEFYKRLMIVLEERNQAE